MRTRAMPASGVEAPKPRSFSPERDERTNIKTPGTDGTSLLGDASRTAPRNAAIPGGSERGDARTRPGRRRLVPVGPPQAAEGALRPAVPSIERHPELSTQGATTGNSSTTQHRGLGVGKKLRMHNRLTIRAQIAAHWWRSFSGATLDGVRRIAHFDKHI